MRILYFHQYFVTPGMAGGTRSYQMARRLIERGHQVTMVCGTAPGRGLGLPGNFAHGLRRGTIEGIDIIEVNLSYSNYDNFIKRTVTFMRFATRCIRIALTADFDLLFATSTPLTIGLPGIIMKLFRNRPFVFEVRDLWPELPRAMGVIKNRLILALMSCLEWMCYRQADAVIALSPGMLEGIRLRSRPGLPIAMIPNGCDLELFRPGRRETLSLAGVGPGDLAAVFTGAHGIANGLDAVLDAAVILQAQGREDIKLVFVGDGKMKPRLVARAGRENLKNCLFIDPMPKRELNALVGAADVGLMVLANVPAFYYGTSPNKFFDYIASGLPVLNNYPGWLADLIAEYQCGVVVPPDDPGAFAAGLARLADDPERRRKMGINARKLAETRFNRAELAEQFADWLEQARRGFSPQGSKTAGMA
jgi:glycosyltransferase involved in cell wall biosynthesis